MTFEELLDQATAMLQRRGRLTYRALKRQFHLDDDYLEDLKAELIQGQRLAVDEDGDVLVWTGDTGSVIGPAAPVPPRQDTTAGPVALLPSPSTAVHAFPLSSLAGERRQVTVLFADISGFTALAETMDPEDVRQVMNACFAQLVPVVATYGGTIDKFIGDEIMALFGAPIAYDNDAERAVRAALAMQEALAAFNTAQGTTLGLHCGLNTGLVIAGGIGTQSRQDYSVMGDAVNLAARLEDASERGQIFVGPETYHLTHTLFRYEPLAPMTLKGKTDPVQVYQVLGLRDVPESHETDAAAELPLVGRASELALLLERWAQATQSLGHVVVLSGEAGIGKSRLAAALGERVVQERHLRFTIRCSPYHTNSALYPIMARLERLLQGVDEEPAAAKVERLEQLLRPTGLPLEHVVPLIAALVSVPLPEGRYTPLRLSPQQQKQQTLETLVTWLLAEATRHPVLSIWEDLHWADPSTLELLELLLRQVPTARMLVVVICRPHFQPPWGMRSYLTPLMLGPLGPQQIEQMVVHITAGKALPSEVMRQIMAETDGVPLFVEECVKMILESSLLQEEDDQYVLTRPLPPLAMPPTLQDILMARLDRLEPGKAVAQLGATVGREFSYALLAAVSPLDESVLQHGLAQLVDAELLYQRGHLPQAQYIFKHALIQEAAYQSLLRSTRQQYHQRIAQVLETRFPATRATQPELLAHHCTEAGLHAQAIPYWQRAGQLASERSAYREAVTCFEQALNVLRHLPEDLDLREQAIDLRLDLRHALARQGEFGRVLAYLGEAETLAQALGDQHRLAQVSSHIADYCRAMGDYDRALEAGQRALALAVALGDVPLQAMTHEHLGVIYYYLGDYRQAIDFLRQSVASIEGELLRERSGMASPAAVEARTRLLRCLAEVGAFAEGVTVGEEGLRMAEALNHPVSLVRAYYSVGFVPLYKGNLRQAIAMFERGLALCQTWDIRDWFLGLTGLLGYAYALSGRLGEALPLLEQVVKQDTRRRRQPSSFWIARLSEGYMLAGRLADALPLAQQALELAHDGKERGAEAWALRLLGEIAAHRALPDVDEATTHYCQALALADELGMRPLMAHCQLGLGRLYGQTGQREQARAALTTAIELHRAMDMTFWLPQAEAVLAQVDGQ